MKRSEAAIIQQAAVAYRACESNELALELTRREQFTCLACSRCFDRYFTVTDISVPAHRLSRRLVRLRSQFV